MLKGSLGVGGATVTETGGNFLVFSDRGVVGFSSCLFPRKFGSSIFIVGVKDPPFS